MISLFWTIISFSLLYFSTRFLTLQFTRLLHVLGGSRKTIIIIWSLIFLPGTVIHELSHFFAAILVGARTGRIEILPEFLDDDTKGVALGSVQTQKLNLVQGVFVGLAPAIVGITLLILLSQSIYQNYITGATSTLLVQSLFFFIISNSFFPSKADIVHVIPGVITFSAIAVLLFFAGFNLLNLPINLINILPSTITTLIISSFLNLIIGGILFTLYKIFKS